MNGGTLIIHNAAFDTGFLDAELERCGRGKISDYCEVIDTIKLAKQLLPGRAVSLASLCRYYEIDDSARTYHGALLDAQLLAEVYQSLTRGQDTFELLNVDADNLPPIPPFEAFVITKATDEESPSTTASSTLQKRSARAFRSGAKAPKPTLPRPQPKPTKLPKSRQNPDKSH